ncbi:tetratricopeptide repeat protein [Streptomyces rhizosphaericus]|uniref:tetratricopeptide repeat protein n=1 Tax=Streptomyces rhizosphaericus TaxID=114699 RepID=UPI00117D845B|nr:tetratricopeptide repeat protein [Streptomyces rhizosphaericus]
MEIMNVVPSVHAAGWYRVTVGLVDGLEPLLVRRRAVRVWIEACEHYGLSAAKAWGDRHAVRRMLIGAGTGLRAAGEYERALVRLAQAQDSARQDGHDEDEARALTEMGHTYWEMGSASTAQPLLDRVVRTRRKAGDPQGAALALILLGNLASASEDHSTAIKHLGRARGDIPVSQDPYNRARALAYLALAQQCKGDYDEATHNLHEALAEFELIDAVYWRARCQEWIGRTLESQGRLDQARDWYRHALAGYTHTCSTRDIARLSTSLEQAGRPSDE